MPLGVIQTGAEHTPGTVLLFDEGVQNATIGFKHSTGKVCTSAVYVVLTGPFINFDQNAHLVLVPQPTNSPNDPLVRFSMDIANGYIINKSRTGQQQRRTLSLRYSL